MPKCPPPPSDEDIAAAKENPESVFDMVDQDKSGDVDADEAADALKCAVKAGLLDEDEAKDAFRGLAKAAGKDGKLSKDEAAAAVDGIELAQKEGGEGPTDAELDAEIERQLKTPPQCPERPSEDEIEAGKEDPEAVFDTIDRDGSGAIDAKEGFDALYCAVEWEMISEDEARGAFKYLAKAAGKDGKLSKDEAEAAMEALSSDEGQEFAQKGGEGDGEGDGPKGPKGGEGDGDDLDAYIDEQLKTPPTCPPAPTDEQIEAAMADPESIFDEVD